MVFSRFFVAVQRLVESLQRRYQEIYFLLMSGFVLIALVSGIWTFLHFYKKPFFPEPKTITELLANPYLMGLFAAFIVLLFGVFFSSMILMVPMRKLAIFKMEVEMGELPEKKREIQNQFTYISTLLYNHQEITDDIIRYQVNDFYGIVQLFIQVYEDYFQETNRTHHPSVEVRKSDEGLHKSEEKIYKKLIMQDETAGYQNHIIPTRENILMGRLENPESESGEDLLIIARVHYDVAFTDLDREFMDCLVAYIPILYDTINMIEFIPNGEDINMEAEEEV